MALPPRGDPRRPLHLAIRSTRMLAILFLLFGVCGMFPIFMIGPRGMRGPAQLLLAASVILFYVGPGAAYLVFSIYLKQRRAWAVVAALVLASIQLLFCVVGAISLGTMIFSNSSSQVALIPLAIVGLFILALAQLIYHLAKSFTAIKYAPPELQRGFEPITTATIYNPPTTDSPTPANPSSPGEPFNDQPPTP